jgi:protease-4
MNNGPGLIRSSLRAFLVAVCTVLGIVVGLLLVAIALGSTSAPQTIEVRSHYNPLVMPNAEGVRKEVAAETPLILVLPVQGVLGGEKINRKTIQQQLVESREGVFKDGRVKALLLHINTPGGTIDDADGIYRAIKQYKEMYKVPVYAFIDGLCASGGMYVIAAADKVFAADVSLVGNVGVILPPFFNVSGAMEKLGISALTVFAGRGKDAMNPTRPWKAGEDDNFRQLTQAYYEQFVDLLTTARPEIDKQKLKEEFGADLFTAQKAKEVGMVDEVGHTWNSVMQRLVDQAGLSNKTYAVISLEETNWLEHLFQGRVQWNAKVTHQLQLGNDIEPELRNKYLYLYRP